MQVHFNTLEKFNTANRQNVKFSKDSKSGDINLKPIVYGKEADSKKIHPDDFLGRHIDVYV